MNTTLSTSSPSRPSRPSASATAGVAGPSPTASPKRPAKPSPPTPSREAKQRAAAILEVLAGARTPSDAAAALGVSLTRYYLLEERALHGLVQACEPQPRGRQLSSESQRAKLERDCSRWQRECARQQALVRAAQRTIGLAAPPTPAVKEGSRKRRRRKPVARALKAVADLRRPEEPATLISTAPPLPS